MLYQVRDYVTEQTLIMLYHSFACNRISNGITAWGTVADKYLKEIETKLNNIVRKIIWNKKFSRVTQLYRNLKLLKLRDVCSLKLAKFMHQIYNNKIPFSIQDKFTKLEKIHSHKTMWEYQHKSRCVCRTWWILCGQASLTTQSLVYSRKEQQRIRDQW